MKKLNWGRYRDQIVSIGHTVWSVSLVSILQTRLQTALGLINRITVVYL